MIKQENEILREHVSRLTEKIEELEAFEKLLSSYINMEETGLAEIVQNIGDIEATKEFLDQAAIDAPSDSLLEQVKSIVQQAEDAQRRVAQVISQGRGIDYPPCWLDEENKAELTFTITVFASADVNIKKRDLPHREQQYSRLPSYPDIITSTINREMFERLALPILEESKTKDCRYYAQVRFDSVEACRFQFVIDKYFYPYVAPSDRHTCTG